jgi:two-component system, OmpR family, clock-associated histidine kinase SasA
MPPLSPVVLNPLHLLLFVDWRPYAAEQIQQLREAVAEKAAGFDLRLRVMDVAKKPQLVEHFRLIATPALVKIAPGQRQILAGSCLLEQLDTWIPRWRAESASEFELPGSDADTGDAHLDASQEFLRQADEMFRLRQECVALEDQLVFRDRILSMLAHDLRTPLTAALLATETLQRQLESPNGHATRPLSPQQLCGLAQQARIQLREIDRMIADLLEASRNPSQALVTKPHRIDLEPLCHEAIAQLRERWKAKQQQIKTDFPSDLPSVYADPDRIRQVIANLLENSIKYTPENGSIQLALLHRTSQKVQFSISDTGPGIPPEQREEIFKETVRLARDANCEGYGIGLAVCQRVIRAHYGRIWVESETNKGSCFHFTLPVYGR